MAEDKAQRSKTFGKVNTQITLTGSIGNSRHGRNPVTGEATMLFAIVTNGQERQCMLSGESAEKLASAFTQGILHKDLVVEVSGYVREIDLDDSIEQYLEPQSLRILESGKQLQLGEK